MITRDIKCKPTADATKSETFSVSFPETLAEVFDTFSEGIAMALVTRSFDIMAQAKYRSLRKGNDKTAFMVESDAVKAMVDWQPEEASVRKTALDKAVEMGNKLSSEELEAFKAMVSEM